MTEQTNKVSDVSGETCEVCGEFIEGFEYEMCCNSPDCGCLGMPIEPAICSEKCMEDFKSGIKQANKRLHKKGLHS